MKKAFTLIEMIIVIWILWLFSRILVWSIKPTSSEVEKWINDTKLFYNEVNELYTKNLSYWKYIEEKDPWVPSGSTIQQEIYFYPTILNLQFCHDNYDNEPNIYLTKNNYPKHNRNFDIKKLNIKFPCDEWEVKIIWDKDWIQTSWIIYIYTKKNNIHIADMIFHNDNNEIELKWCYPPAFSWNCTQ
jgi:hypothetical protein